MGGSIFRRYRDRSRINSAHDVGKHWSFLAAESCNLIIGLKSVIPFLTKVKKPSTCGPRLFVRLLTLVGILDRIWMRLRFLNNKIILPGTDLYNSTLLQEPYEHSNYP